jgi:hypothetical protein
MATGEHDWWFPDDDAPDAELQYARARRVCARCPVRLQCAEFGLAGLPLGLTSGMHGGLTPAELAELADQLSQPDHKVAQHGTRSRYVAGPCEGYGDKRCPACTEAHRRYEADRRARHRFAGHEEPRVDRSALAGDAEPWFLVWASLERRAYAATRSLLAHELSLDYDSVCAAVDALIEAGVVVTVDSTHLGLAGAAMAAQRPQEVQRPTAA